MLLFPFQACFSALHCHPPSFGLRPHLHRRAAVAITPQTPPPLHYAVAPNLFGLDADMLIPDDKPAPIQTAEHYRQYCLIGEEKCHKETSCHFN
jgi:hypothetical protein